MIYYDILDEQRRALLPSFSMLKERGFYLAGGTGLALLLGHRDSIDFDFFRKEPFDAGRMLIELRAGFAGRSLIVTVEDKDTLGIIIDDSIRLSLFAYPYALVGPLVPCDHFDIASLEDIGAMKLSAIASRATLKDYIDMYFILQHISLDILIEKTKRKMPMLDPAILLKSLVYFDDVRTEPLVFKRGNTVQFEDVQKKLIEYVRVYSQSFTSA